MGATVAVFKVTAVTRVAVGAGVDEAGGRSRPGVEGPRGEQAGTANSSATNGIRHRRGDTRGIIADEKSVLVQQSAEPGRIFDWLKL